MIDTDAGCHPLRRPRPEAAADRSAGRRRLRGGHDLRAGLWHRSTSSTRAGWPPPSTWPVPPASPPGTPCSMSAPAWAGHRATWPPPSGAPSRASTSARPSSTPRTTSPGARAWPTRCPTARVTPSRCLSPTQLRHGLDAARGHEHRRPRPAVCGNLPRAPARRQAGGLRRRAGSGEALHFPVPWSRVPETSFLMTPAAMRSTLERHGFTVQSWTDRTAEGVAWFEQQRAARAQATAEPQRLGLHLAMGPDFQGMTVNLARNLAEGRARMLEAVLRQDLPRSSGELP